MGNVFRHKRRMSLCWCLGALLLVIVGSLSACTQGIETLQAKTAIEHAWNKRSVGLISGEVRFIGGLAGPRWGDAAKGEDAASELPLYRAFAAKGYITISDERETKNGGWDAFFQMTQNGVLKTARVTITPLGRQNGEVETTGKVEQLWLSAGTAKIERIVSSESYQVGSEKYRVVQGLHTWDVDPELASAYTEARGNNTMGRERKFRALLVYDAFGKQWKHLGADVGPREGQFTTNQVDQAVMSFQRS